MASASASLDRSSCSNATKQVGHGVKEGVEIFTKIITNIEDAGKLAGTIKKIIAFFDGVVKAVAEGVNNFAKALGGFVSVVELFAGISLIWKLASGKIEALLEKISKIFLAIFCALASIQFLESLKLFSLSSFFEKLGSIPVLGLIVHVPISIFGLVGSSVDIAYRSQLLAKNKLESEACQKVCEHWKRKQTFYDDKVANKTLSSNSIKALKRGDARILKLRNDMFAKGFKKTDDIIQEIDSAIKVKAEMFGYNIAPEALSDNHKMNVQAIVGKNGIMRDLEAQTKFFDENKNLIKLKLENDIRKLEVMSKNTKVENSRSWFSIAINIAKIVLAVLAIVALAGVALFAMTSPLMLAFGGAVALLGIAKVVFDKIYSKERMQIEVHQVTDELKVQLALHTDIV
jgi:hypothetical protein